MLRRTLFGLAFAALCAPAMSFVAPVSAYDFNNTLNAYWATNAHVGALDYRSGGSPTSSAGAPTYSSQTVGATLKNVASFTSTTFFRALHGIGANGGGQYVNNYSILMDVKFQRTNEAWASLFNTTADNGNDGDSFVQWGVGVGTAGNYGGTVPDNAWTRLVLVVHGDPTGTTVDYYADGTLIHTSTGIGGGTDGRWSAYSWDDNDTDSDSIDILADNDGDTTPGMISQLAFFDQVLNGDQVSAFGRVGTVVPEPATIAVVSLGLLALRRRRK